MRIINSTVLLAALLTALVPAPVRAVTAISNFGYPYVYSSLLSAKQAVSFTTGDAPSTLNSATVEIGVPGIVSLGGSIRADASGAPGAVLESFLGQHSAPLTTYQSVGLPLAPDTTYWLVVSLSAGFLWDATTADQTSAYGWTIGDHLFFSSDNITWSDVHFEPDAVGRFSIDATVLPEPATLALALATLPCLALRRQRR